MHKIIKTLTHNKFAILLKESWKEFNAQNGTHLAASISFNLFFSLFPFTFVALFIAGFITGTQSIHQQIITGISYILPESRQLIQSVISNVTSASSEINVLAFIGTVWGGISFFNAVRVALNTAWDVKNPPSVLKGQLINFIMMIAAGVLLTLSVLLTILLTANAPTVQGAAFITRFSTTRILADIFITILAFLVFLLLYKFIPHSRPKWKDIWIGALASAVTFEITKIIFIGYVRIFHPYNLVYGSIGIVIAFLMWTYLSALAFIFIAKTIHTNLKMRSGNRISNPHD